MGFLTKKLTAWRGKNFFPKGGDVFNGKLLVEQ